MIRDMTEGKIAGTLWRFSLPLLLSVMFQQAYNIADSVIAGKFVGEHALAAVGNSYELTLIFMAFAVGSNIGCSVVISQLFGAKRYGGVRAAVRTTMVSSVTLAAVLTVLGFVLSPVLLRAVRTPDAIFADTLRYLQIYCGGLVFLFLYNIATGIFSALGDSRTPLSFLIASSAANIGLDIWFVTAFDMGVAGVAWATFLAQGAACVGAVFTVFRRLRALPQDGTPVPWFSLPLFRRIVRVSVPSILQQSFISVGNIVIQGMINGYGPGVIAGYSAAVKLNNFAITSFTALANGMSNFAAQNLGAGKPRRVRRGAGAALLLAAVTVTPFALSYSFLHDGAIRLFLEAPSADALRNGALFLQIVSPFYYIVVVKLISDSVLRGAGAMRYFMISTFTDLILRVVLSAVFSGLMGAVGIWLSWPVGWIAGTAVSVVFYRMGVWEKRFLPAGADM